MENNSLSPRWQLKPIAVVVQTLSGYCTDRVSQLSCHKEELGCFHTTFAGGRIVMVPEKAV